MRSQRRYINEDGTSNIQSSFLSCEKDAELILKKLFVDSRPYSEELKRLLLINTKDCLDDKTNPAYLKVLNETSITDMINEEYIRLQPNLKFKENEETKSYLVLSFDDFAPTRNSHYRDCSIEVDVLCHIDTWNLGNYRLRPIKMAGYVDGILNDTKLTGIGTLQFMSCTEVVLSENLAGYCLIYRAVHGDDDTIESEDE